MALIGKMSITAPVSTSTNVATISHPVAPAIPISAPAGGEAPDHHYVR
jgi:hypothetical protein